MYRLLSLLFLFSIFLSCSYDTIKKRDIIDDDKFMSLLIDFHKAEGIITIANLNRKKHNNDTLSPYNYILKKHNISREDFDKTLNYYANHTAEYIPFYDSINNYFLAQQKDLELQIEEGLKKMTPRQQFASKNLWTKKQEWIFSTSKKTGNINLDFNIKTKYQGKYILKVDVFTKPNIKTIVKRVKFYANYFDGSRDSSQFIKKTDYLKNKKYKHLEFNIVTNKNKKLKSISGKIIKFSKKEKTHFHLKNIEINYTFKNNTKRFIK